MTQKSNSKHVYDLEERTFQFAKNVRILVKKLPKTIANIFINHRKVKIIVLVIVILIVEIYLLFGACVLEFKC
jgi:hypothetical protein